MIEIVIPTLKQNKQVEKLSLLYNVLNKYTIQNNNLKDALYYEE